MYAWDGIQNTRIIISIIQRLRNILARKPVYYFPYPRVDIEDPFWEGLSIPEVKALELVLPFLEAARVFE